MTVRMVLELKKVEGANYPDTVVYANAVLHLDGTTLTVTGPNAHDPTGVYRINVL